VEIQLICGEGFAVSAIVDVEVEGIGLDCALVRDRDPSMLLKGHGEETVQGLIGSDLQRDRLVQVIIAESQAEEVANGSLHAGRGLTVPRHAKHQRLEMIGIVAGDCDPHVADEPGTGFVEQSQRFSGSYAAGIGISSATVVAGRTVLNVVFGLRKGRKPR
jgi:hypothetical protein